MWEQKIRTWWANNSGLSKEKAEEEFLFVAEELDMYGTQYYPIRSLLDLCVGTHNLYLRRRQPDLLEVQQMKQQADEQRRRRMEEQVRLHREREQRAQAEQERDRYRAEMNHLSEQLSAMQNVIRSAEETQVLIAERARLSEQEAIEQARRANEAEAEAQRAKLSQLRAEETKMMLERKMRETEMAAQRMAALQHQQQQKQQQQQNGITTPGAAIVAQQQQQQQIRQPPPYQEVENRQQTQQMPLVVRSEYNERNPLLRDRLANFRAELDSRKREGTDTQNDRLFAQKVMAGDAFDKFSTLRKTPKMPSSKYYSLSKQNERAQKDETSWDAHFLVGKKQELLSASRQYLAPASNVFKTMFDFDAKNGKDEDLVIIPDIDAPVFQLMLNFIYTRNLNGLDGRNIIQVLYAAHKYDLPELTTKACKKVPISKLSNVFIAFEDTKLLGLKHFSRRCLAYIDQRADTLLKSEEFLQIDQQMLCGILERDQLKINDELTIWTAALRWADWQCAQKGIECSAKNRREMLGSALFKIRFPNIRNEDFAKEIVPSGVLTEREVAAVYHYNVHPIHGNDGPPLMDLQLNFPFHGRISDWNKPFRKRSTLSMEIEKLSEFAQESVGGVRVGPASIQMNGLPWKIGAMIKGQATAKWLCFFLWCHAENGWNCRCSATFRIVSDFGVAEHAKTKKDKDLDGPFDYIGFADFISFAELMDPSKGFYNKEEDKVTLAIDFAIR
ncbi:hypothetical protein niasHT_020733 [Heterodera trifolii]|uniref:BTB domain-containing protein n=1 Tax=Heterodera trifolii TaxID=157864 RepID=A0ABD2JJ38_9BILA